MNILVTLNSNYIPPLKIMLKSMFINNPKVTFTVYLMHSSITDHEIDDLKSYIEMHKSKLEVLFINEDDFTDAPAHSYYTKEMYYRLLAYKFLPEDIDRVLYLDPDILVINSLEALYNLNIDDYLFAAAFHDIPGTDTINKVRFYPYELKEYYNSGVLLMNLENQRNKIKENEIFKFVEEYFNILIFPDQDVLNALYSQDILTLDEKIYNYDVRFYSLYKISSKDEWDMTKVIYNTVILHFCGKNKPWRRDYKGNFHSLYKYYEKLTFNKFSE
ncbi:MAG: glycosyltransferase family 8 protein [Neofamilia sp.]